MSRDNGLTILEVVVAIAICAVLMGGLSVVATSALREGRSGSYKTQSTQILSAIGRRIAGGEDQSLLLAPGQQLTLSSGGLAAVVDTGPYAPEEFNVAISNEGSLVIGASALYRYEITVCATAAGSDERCVAGTTLAPRSEP